MELQTPQDICPTVSQYIYMGLQIPQDFYPNVSIFHNSYFVLKLCGIDAVTIRRLQSQLYMPEIHSQLFKYCNNICLRVSRAAAIEEIVQSLGTPEHRRSSTRRES